MARTIRIVLVALLLSSAGVGAKESADGTAGNGQGPVLPTRPPFAIKKKGVVRWIVVGGGPEPSSTEVSLEQDVGLAEEMLGDGGVTLFAGGSSAAGVRVLQGRRKMTLLAQLANLFDPRQGRDSSYRRPEIAVDGAATRALAVDAIDRSLRPGRTPLLLYFATHGEKGETARDNGVHLWGNQLLTVADLAAILDNTPSNRAVRLVVTACYSGGFADLAFADADAERGDPAVTPRCGLFASEWDEVSSGCDPNPNRRSQEGYGIHFLNALRSRDRFGKPLDAANIDFDGDGKVSLLEAHTRTRIASRSMGVPTSTSERWLRHAAPKDGARSPVPLPEEEAVIKSLSDRLGLNGEGAARRRLRKLEQKLAEFDERLAVLEEEEADRYERLRIAMLARWPVLDDPWHPLFSRTFEIHSPSIRRILTQSSFAVDYREARRKADRLDAHYHRTLWRSADVRRLVRAYDTVALASRLRAAGGPAWEHYERLLSCERGTWKSHEWKEEESFIRSPQAREAGT